MPGAGTADRSAHGSGPLADRFTGRVPAVAAACPRRRRSVARWREQPGAGAHRASRRPGMAGRKRGRQPDSSSRLGMPLRPRERCMAYRDNHRSRQHRDVSSRGAPMCLWSSWRGFRTNRPGSGWLAAVCFLLLLGQLSLSAQHVIWLTPAAGSPGPRRDRRSVGMAALAVLPHDGSFWSYLRSGHGAGAPAALTVVVRNVVLALLPVSALPGPSGAWSIVTATARPAVISDVARASSESVTMTFRGSAGPPRVSYDLSFTSS